jgi:hypothetical protein
MMASITGFQSNSFALSAPLFPAIAEKEINIRALKVTNLKILFIIIKL